MRLLHVTDLHYAQNSPFQVSLIKALVADLKTQAAAEQFDLVVFSGDLVNNPDDPNIYEEFENSFLGPVLATTGLTPGDVIFCPGNHDIAQQAVKAWTDERKNMIGALPKQADLEKHLARPPTQAYIKALNAGFFGLDGEMRRDMGQPALARL